MFSESNTRFLCEVASTAAATFEAHLNACRFLALDL